MKTTFRTLFLSLAILVSALSLSAQNDTMYIMRSGLVVGQYNVNTQIDSIIFYRPANLPTSGFFIDERDGQQYAWIKIGDQIWMAENLRYLPNVVGPNTISETTPYHYVYDYDGTDVNAAKATDNFAEYGVLYNHAAALQACPEGWHLPTDAEWQELEMQMGLSASQANTWGWRGSVEGGKLKEAGYDHWDEPNTGATNESGFAAFAGGNLAGDTFVGLRLYGLWWTSSTEGEGAWCRDLGNINGGILRYYDNKACGFSIRCIKD